MGKVELGQGIGTALAQIAADELGVAFENVRLVTVDTDYSPDESYTFSSISIQQSGPKVREAAAKAREYLDQQTGTLSTSTISAVGKSVQRIDIPGKVFGDESFIQDLRLAGMVHARVLRPPAERANIKSIDSDPVLEMPGVLKIVRDGDFVGVIAEREGQAREAALALKARVEWSLPEDLPETDKVHEWLKKAESRTEEVAAKGSVAISATDTSVHRATYQRPYQAHASISPSAAVALYDDSRLNVWSHAQVVACTWKRRDAMAITARMTPPAMLLRLRWLCPADRFVCSGSAAMSFSGSHWGRPCRLRLRRFSTIAVEYRTGNTICGVARTRAGRAVMKAPGT